jgi:hypothetical protein
MRLRQRFVVSKSIVGLAVGFGAVISTGLLAARAAIPISASQGQRPPAAASSADSMIELRVYTIAPDTWEGTLRFMENVNRFQDTVGMKIVGHFTDKVANRYIWMRSYPSEAVRLKLFTDVYESETWKSGQLRPKDAKVGITNTEVYLTKPTKYSKLQYPPPPSASLGSTVKPSGQSQLIFEVTLQQIRPDMMDTWVKYMGEKVVPFQEAQGVRVFAQLVPYVKLAGQTNGGARTPETNTFASVRIYPDEATRQRQQAILLEKEPAAKLGPPAEAGLKAEWTRVYRGNPTTYSKLQ